MQDEKLNTTPSVGDEKIQWFGLDGFLVGLYFVEALVFGYCLLYDVDFMIGTVAPYFTLGVTTMIFLKYILEVFSFSHKTRKSASR